MDWTGEVIRFLRKNVYVENNVGGHEWAWVHTFTSAYQMGCEALVALGQADETVWGALPRSDPRLPEVLPRWDDVCVAVLWLAGQQGRLDYRPMDGTLPEAPSWARPRASNILASSGLGPAYADDELVTVLAALGLVEDGNWSSVAETVLWRDRPREWELKVEADNRFKEAVGRACDTVPEDIRENMDQLASIAEEDVQAEVTRILQWMEEQREKYGANAALGPGPTPVSARRTVESVRRHSFDWIFIRGWRLGDGWLTPEAASHALEIFHDPLAMDARCAVTQRLYPQALFLHVRH